MPILNQMNKQGDKMNNLEMAQQYIAEGFSVLAVKSNNKEPLYDSELQPNGGKSATNDYEIAEKLFKKYPDANIGIATGKISGINVIDLDDKSAVANLKEVGLEIPKTRYVKTPRGYHFYIEYDENLSQTAGLVDKVDVRADGGYVLAPPSIVNGKEYTSSKEVSIVKWSEITEFQQNKVKEKRSQSFIESINGNKQPTWVSDALRGVGEGQRNDMASRLAGYFRSKNISKDVAIALMEQYRSNCDPPMEVVELMQVIDSIYSGRYQTFENYENQEIETPIVEVSIANRRVFRYPEQAIVINCTSITKRGDSLSCQIEIEDEGTPITAPRRINMLSSSSVDSLRKELTSIDAERNWKSILSNTFILIHKSLETSSVGHDMRTYKPEITQDGWSAKPYVKENQSNLIMGAGGTGKSTIAIATLLSKASGKNLLPNLYIREPSAVMFCDWEASEQEFYSIMYGLLRGAGLTEKDLLHPVIYRRFDAPLVNHLEEIQRDISKHNIELICIDSVVASGNEDTNSPESARTYHQAVRSLGVSSLGITHITKSGSDTHAYGSVFFTNLSRNIWSAEKDDDQDGNTSIIGMYHRKGNNTGGVHKPVGYEVTFVNDEDDNTVSISYDFGDLNKSSNLSAKQTNAEKILYQLKTRPMNREELSEETDIALPTLRVTLQRLEARNKIRNSGGQYYINENDI